MNDSRDLLSEYANNGTESAFRELVSRYIDLVYSTALRKVGGNTHLAEDVTQTVFLHLARKAQTISSEVMLGGWLHQTACNVAATAVRTERRREARERQAVQMNTLQEDATFNFERIAPLLDEAIGQLPSEDRTAVLLRFFEKRDFRAVGEALGSSEDAARVRVNRALEKLASLLKRRGITSTAAALSVALSAHVVQSAPVGLAGSIATTALAGTALSVSNTIAATKLMAMTTMQKALLAATLALVGGTGIYEAHQNSKLHAHNQQLQGQQAFWVEQVQAVQRERDQATNRLAALAEEVARLGNNATELLRLRAEVTGLRQAQTNPTPTTGSMESTARDWLKQVDLIKAKFEQWPDKKIPELEFLADYDWLQAARGQNVEQFSEQTMRHILANLRLTAKRNVAHRLGNALESFIADHDGQLPTQLSELNAYYERYIESPPMLQPALLERYQLLQSGSLANLDPKEPLIVEKAPPVDPDYDSHFQITAFGYNYEAVGKESDLGQGSGTFNHFDKIRKFQKQ